jgi:streptogramin lyase
MTVDGTAVQRFALANGSEPREIVTGPDGSLWFTVAGRNRIGRMRYTTTGNVVLHGRITEPGFNDRHWVAINWGDGSGPEVLALNPGIHTFSVPHTYAPGNYPITVTVLDDDTGEGAAQISAVVP